ncbi:MAG: VOC family protein [Pseudomonadota bacterium]
MSAKQSPKKEPIVKQAALCQIGIVVKSVDETIKYLSEKFGFGPFETLNVDFPTATYHGKTAGYRGRRGFFNMGPIQIELIELVDGKTIHADFLNEHGEGLHHLGFLVEDLEESEKNAGAAGFKVTQGFSRADGMGFAYIDSDKVGGIIFELIKRPKK